MSFNFFMPPHSLMGPGCLNDAGIEIKSLGYKKALIVTDKILCEIGLIDKLTNILNENEVDYIIYDKTKPNPTVTNVNEGLKILKDEKCDFVISFGGGSPHDCGKGIALLAANGGIIKDYIGFNRSNKPQIPLVTINTTAGTASEMTICSVITDEEDHIKMTVVDKHLNPMIAVNDPLLMTAMPSGLTAATGMDALTHAIEAYVSTMATPVTDACALMAIKLISNNLRDAVADGNNKDARDKMAYGEYLAGMAFNNAGVGYVHAMAHQLGGIYNLPHGICNAVLLPYVMEYNATFIPKRLKEVAEAMGIDVTEKSDDEGSQAAVSALKELSKDIGIPQSLTSLGVKKDSLELLAEGALKDPSGLTSPKQVTHEEVITIFKNAM